MYCKHHGFSEKPFDVTSNPRFLFLRPDHQETLASIEYGIRERRGFITLIGEVGTGKTTLLNAAVDRMDRKTRVAFIFTTNVTFDEMLNMALYELKLIKINETVSKVDGIRRLNHFAMEQLRKGGNVLLIIDEAQNLDDSVLEELRLLSNLETPKHKLIQVILSGQPELDTKLNRNELRQFAQRISIRRYISPLNEKDTYSYLQHRLKLVQDKGTLPFTPKAQKLIWEYTQGVPRKINILCDNAFLIGYGLNKKKINEDMILEAACDLKWHPSSDTKTPWNSPAPGSTHPSSGTKIPRNNPAPESTHPSSDTKIPRNNPASESTHPSSDTKAPRNNPASGSSGFTQVETKPPKQSHKLTKTMIIAGIIIIIGSFFLNSKDVRLTKLTGFISNLKNTTLKSVHPEQAKEKEQLSPSNIFVQAVPKPKVKFREVPKENDKRGTQKSNTEISSMTPNKYYPVKEKSFELISQDSEIQNTKLKRTFDEPDPSAIQVKDKEIQHRSASENQTGDKEKSKVTEAAVKEAKIARQVMIKKGDTLHKIITQTYGTYDDIILSKIQRQNPEIIDPDLILSGQVINLPEN
jgi:type II secretory pathway predicted ATPase ExeA